VALIPLKKVTVKMLPFDNKDEFEVVLTLPEGAALSETRRAAAEMADALKGFPEVTHVTQYLGLGAPYNFNGLVRHYYLRERPHQADVMVSLKNRHERDNQSHVIAQAARELLRPIADKYHARLQVAEVPPGPPVLSTLVFELYGPDEARRRDLARALKTLLEGAPGIVDVDTYVPEARSRDRLEVLRSKATLNGVSAEHIARSVSLGLQGDTVDWAHDTGEKEPVEIRLRLPPEARGDLRAVQRIPLLSRNGTPLPVGSLTEVQRGEVDPPIYHKNLQRVSYVVADVAGQEESPVYAILTLRQKIQELARSRGLTLTEYFNRLPSDAQADALKWDGEWQITYEVFRDLGLAFALVLVLIYVLVVGWFKSFSIPLVIMVPIPLTLVGILPAHWGLGAFFTATSMIGFIAGAGIVVRNSIILVDFIQLRIKEGMPLKEAVIDAGAVRFRPMLLTAAAVVVGAGVILFDPIFQGLAAVSNMGRNRTAPASITASFNGIPSFIRSCIKSTKIMEFRTTIPAPAMNPIMEVAVKKAPRPQWAGKIPTRVKGIGTMITRGMENDLNHPTTNT
jgi:multidrug efflux pump subunit AcrB